jgi:large subunit ribosomal protein L1
MSSKFYSISDAVDIIKKTAKAKFDETVELHVKLFINTKRSDNSIRGIVSLPHGTGKSRKVAVLAKGEKQKEAEIAGADFIGYETLINDILNEKINFDILIATPDVMKDLGKIAKILGSRGLMPNPKSGTITFDISSLISEFKNGRIEYRADSFGIIHVGVGKVSFEKKKIEDNILILLESIIKLKPTNIKGRYIDSISVSTTMGKGVFVDQNIKN